MHHHHALVPYPRHLTRQPGSFDLDASNPEAVAARKLPVCIRHKLRELGLSIRGDATDEFTVRIGEGANGRLRPPAHAEGYVLHCDRKGIEVRGHDADGLFWGLTTLQQLMNGSRRVPCVKIRDYPTFGFRHHHDDISRKQVSRVVDFKRIIRRLSSYKVRYYSPYMEDMLYLKSHPDIGEGRGRLTPNEIRQILAEAGRYNVTVFPTFSLIGHQENLLSNPKYRKYAREVFQPPSSFDPGKPILRPFLRKVIRDVCELFPDAPYFHACFDETQGLEAKELMAHANWCAEEIGKHGKQMLMWVDMFKNHYGLKNIHKLSNNIIPVEWNYADPTQHESAYLAANITPLGLAGYRNWCRFLPDFRQGQRNMAAWAGVMKRWGGDGFGVSMWGDNGYENSRDLCWNLYAFGAETAWRGAKPRPDFEKRFQASFYGRPLPALARMIKELPRERGLDSGEIWRLFRVTMPGMIRRVTESPAVAARARSDATRLRRAIRSLATAHRQAEREKAHIDHFEVALIRELNTCERLILADRIAQGLTGKGLRSGVEKACERLDLVRRRYREIWLRHNKRAGLEVSLAVYTEIADSLRALLAPAPPVRERFVEIGPDTFCNTFFYQVAGVPLGRRELNGVPFTFAPADQTHGVLRPGKTFRMPIDPASAPSVRDIHIVYGGQTLKHKDNSDVLEVTLLHDGKTVFSETFKNIKDICCWWAPLGEHIWAGGGYKYVNKRRNTWVWKPGNCYGLMHLNGFKLGRGRVADTLTLRAVGQEEIAIFAVTVETIQA